MVQLPRKRERMPDLQARAGPVQTERAPRAEARSRLCNSYISGSWNIWESSTNFAQNRFRIFEISYGRSGKEAQDLRASMSRDLQDLSSGMIQDGCLLHRSSRAI